MTTNFWCFGRIKRSLTCECIKKFFLFIFEICGHTEFKSGNYERSQNTFDCQRSNICIQASFSKYAKYATSLVSAADTCALFDRPLFKDSQSAAKTARFSCRCPPHSFSHEIIARVWVPLQASKAFRTHAQATTHRARIPIGLFTLISMAKTDQGDELESPVCPTHVVPSLIT